ncbi:MAG: quinone-dependent dihydroorotate dehydrogenase [Betaproteobacteria bacterium]|nr:quinone-dependent dihydroorotate dehydrogenase [Betaproteobacteria bacterium]
MHYSLLRPLLFALDPERAHALTLDVLDRTHALGLGGLVARPARGQPARAMGIDFPNAVGLAAGMDKDGAHIDALAALGFGFIEIGTVTPRPQPGNPQPRMFRLPEAHALINRLGFNNGGVDALLANVERSRFAREGGVLGINIGKNFDTPIERAADDYLACLRKVYSRASYVTVNISSPNTANLRELQDSAALGGLLGALKQEQAKLTDAHRRHVPLAVKIAPDLTRQQVRAMAAILFEHDIEAVIATNTTIARDAVAHLRHGNEAGGLSGAPLRAQATQVIRWLHEALQGALPIIGVGGILSGADALEKTAAGAALVQFYTGMVYRGPDLVAECVKALANQAGATAAVRPAMP